MDRTREFMQVAERLRGDGVNRVIAAMPVSLSSFQAGANAVERSLTPIALRVLTLSSKAEVAASAFRTPADSLAIDALSSEIERDLSCVSGRIARLMVPTLDDAVMRHSLGVIDILRSKVLSIRCQVGTLLRSHARRMQQTGTHERSFSFPPSEQVQVQVHTHAGTPSDEALRRVHHTLVETGTLYQHLSLLVAEQGDAAIRIDDNVTESLLHVDRATHRVRAYVGRMTSSSGWLALQVAGVLGVAALVLIAVV